MSIGHRADTYYSYYWFNISLFMHLRGLFWGSLETLHFSYQSLTRSWTGRSWEKITREDLERALFIETLDSDFSDFSQETRIQMEKGSEKRLFDILTENKIQTCLLFRDEGRVKCLAMCKLQCKIEREEDARS